MTAAEERDVRVLATPDLDAEVRAAIVDVCNAANGHEGFHELFDLIQSGGRHVLAFDGEEVVAHAVVTERWLQPEGMPLLRTGFVDAVATRPHRQGEGHGTAVMALLGASIDDFEVGALQTDLRGYYERLGWRFWRGPLAGRRGDELVPTPDQQGVMVLETPSTPALDLDALLTIECQPRRIWE